MKLANQILNSVDEKIGAFDVVINIPEEFDTIDLFNLMNNAAKGLTVSGDSKGRITIKDALKDDKSKKAASEAMKIFFKAIKLKG